MAGDVKPIPDGFHAITPHLVIKGAAKAIDWYKRAFGAEELGRMPMPNDDRLMHALIRIGDSMVMLVDEMPEFGAMGPDSLGGTAVTINLYVEDADKAFARAVAAGAEATMPPADMFWGDRYGRLKDPFGHSWAICTHVRDVSPEEMAEGAKAAMSQQK